MKWKPWAARFSDHLAFTLLSNKRCTNFELHECVVSLLTPEDIGFKCDLYLQFIPPINLWIICIDLRPFSKCFRVDITEYLLRHFFIASKIFNKNQRSSLFSQKGLFNWWKKLSWAILKSWADILSNWEQCFNSEKRFCLLTF